MIDLHCHLLPGIDDGPADLRTAVEMARMAVDDGIRILACTPHIYPGMYENKGDGIRAAVAQLQAHLVAERIPLRLTVGADVHLVPDLLDKLRSGEAPTLAGSRYFLLEPPHHVAPPRFEEFVFNVIANGFVPVITHPERLTWIGDHYEAFCRLVQQGAWMQLTAGSLTGRFGEQAQFWAELMLDEGRVHILATDAHSTGRRAPLLTEARIAAERRVGPREAENLVLTRPSCVMRNLAPAASPPLPEARASWKRRKRGILSRLLG